MPMIGDITPAFKAVSTQGEMNFPEDYYGKWLVLFSYQADFTPVSTTELMAFASMEKEFSKLGTQLVGFSVDSIYSHIAWLHKIKEISWKDIKHIDITIPLVADITMEIAKKFGLLHLEGAGTLIEGAVFIIDPERRIRAILYYPQMVGRSIQEIKRIVIALQKADSENAVTPPDWLPGEDVMLIPPDHSSAATDRTKTVKKNMYCLDWFLCFRQFDNTTGS